MNASPAPPLRIVRLVRYPIKGAAGSDADALPLDAWGPTGDRRFVVVGANDGVFLTQREHPRLARLRPVWHDGDGSLTLTAAADGPAPLTLPPDAGNGARLSVTVWRHTGPAEDAGDAAAAWLSDFLGAPCRLARLAPDWGRGVGSAPARRDDDWASFVDGYPLLLTAEASLADLNAHLPAGHAPTPMDRFRPNVVVSGDAAAWAEDEWRTLVHAPTGALLRVAKPCARCAVTTVDQTTGEPDGPEPLRTLAAHRRAPDGKVLFGVYLLHDPTAPLTLRVGDAVRAEG